MLPAGIVNFLNSELAKVVFGVLVAAFLFIMYKQWTKSTAPKIIPRDTSNHGTTTNPLPMKPPAQTPPPTTYKEKI